MSHLFHRDFLIEVQKGGIIPGHSMVHKFGRNMAVANASWELVSILGGATSFLSAADTVRIKTGGNINDTETTGAGAREVTVEGIDSNLAIVSEAIATKGSSVSSSTTASFWRVLRAWVSAVGTYGAANTAAITIEDTSASMDMIQIAAGEGQTQRAAYTIPTGKTGYLLAVHITVDAAKAADLRLFTRENFNDTSGDMASKRIKFFWDGIIGQVDYNPEGPDMILPALTDIWIEAEGSTGAATEVSAGFELLLVNN